jgi:hypothetical protein
MPSEERRTNFPWALLPCAVGAILGAVAPVGAQTIDSLSSTMLERSGRLIVRGSAFGADQGAGSVMVGGAEAHISFWSDTKIHAYVPEDAPLGAGDVQVFAPNGSNTVQLEVTLRPPPDGRVQWRFMADANMIRSQPAVGPDGTVYFTTMYGKTYALAPDGGLRWIRGGFGNTAPSVGADGTIYVGAGVGLTAFNPDGSEKWQAPIAGTQFGGPNVGPDGNIYGVAGGYNGTETGAYVVSPDGDLLFKTAPRPARTSFPPTGISSSATPA